MSGLNGAMIFTGNANPNLANKIAENLNEVMGRADVLQFSDGEIRVEVNETVRGKPIFVVQPTCAPTNDNLMELLIMADALRRSAVKKITAVIPFYGYARQDRRPDFTRTPITSRLVADMIQAAGIKQVITVDLHSGQQQGFFTIPVLNVSAAPEIVGDIWRTQYQPGKRLVVVSPDVGGVVRARVIAKQVDNADLVIVDKRRQKANHSQVMNIIGDVEDATCIIVDDMIDTAGTLCNAAKALKEHGAKSVTAYATHPVFSGPAYDNIAASELDGVVVTDTIPVREDAPDQIRVLSVANILSETIRRIRSKKSVSEIYTGG